jgi:hypothetical protein
LVAPVFNVLNRLNLLYELDPLLDEPLTSAALGEQLLGSFRKLPEASGSFRKLQKASGKLPEAT